MAALLVAAVQHWADAGASAAQINLLENTPDPRHGPCRTPAFWPTPTIKASGLTAMRPAGAGSSIRHRRQQRNSTRRLRRPNGWRMAAMPPPISYLLTVLQHEMGHVIVSTIAKAPAS
jgi:hypothetical protein